MPFCVRCGSRISWSWFNKYKFCSDSCRIYFMEEFRKTNKKIPHDFGYSKNQIKARRKDGRLVG